MTKIILTISFLTLAICQFQSGTISAGSLFHFTTVMEGDGNSNGDLIVIGTNAKMYTSKFAIKPTLNYFLLPFLSVDMIFDYTKIIETTKQDATIYSGLGIGASYYINQSIYIGAGVFKSTRKLEYNSNSLGSATDYKVIAKYNNLYGGYLVPIHNYIFLDLNCSYLIGLTEEQYSTTNQSAGINETIFTFTVGIKAFF